MGSTWESSCHRVDTKAVSKGFGGNAMGFATYTPNGRVSFMAIDAKRRPPAQTNATDDEAISLYHTMNAYVGSYRIQGDQINIHIDISSDQTSTNTDTIRFSRSMATGSPQRHAAQECVPEGSDHRHDGGISTREIIIGHDAHVSESSFLMDDRSYPQGTATTSGKPDLVDRA
jgi:hypothetical protein